MSMDHCLIYLSSSTDLFDQEELTQILSQSQANNHALGITGVLLYFNGSIIQVLEGPKEQVMSLYAKICRDPRHTRILQLYAAPITERTFPNWSMGYKTMSAKDLDNLNEVVELKNGVVTPANRSKNPAIAMLQLFYQNNYQN